jgi:hypothetical protein
MYLLDDGTQVAENFKGKIGFLEGVGNAVIRKVRESDFIEVIAGYEGIEYISAKDGHGGNIHCETRKICGIQSVVERLSHRDQSVRLASQLTLPNASQRSFQIKEIPGEIYDG